MRKIKQKKEKHGLSAKGKPMGYELFLIVVGVVIGLFFTGCIVPFISQNIFHRKELIGVRVFSRAQLPGVDSQLGNYELAMENKSKSFDLENIYASMDFPFVIQNVRMSANQGVVSPQLSQGSTPIIYQNNQARTIPTNHLNMAAGGISPGGLFAVSVFVHKNPQSAAAPFTGLNPQVTEGTVVYSYTFLGSKIKRNMRFKIPQLQEP